MSSSKQELMSTVRKLKKSLKKPVSHLRSMLIRLPAKSRISVTFLTQHTINSSEQPTTTTKKLFRRFLKSFMSKAIFTRVSMKECTAHLANPSGQNHSSLTANVPTAAVMLNLHVKRHISLSSQNIRNSLKIISKTTKTSSIPKAAKRRCSTTLLSPAFRIYAFLVHPSSGVFRSTLTPVMLFMYGSMLLQTISQVSAMIPTVQAICIKNTGLLMSILSVKISFVSILSIGLLCLWLSVSLSRSRYSVIPGSSSVRIRCQNQEAMLSMLMTLSSFSALMR